MSRPLLYDLYSGAGGAARGYQLAGFEVWGVDIRPQPRFCGERFIQMDAFEFVGRVRSGEYPTPAAWHASPPCQSYLNLTRLNESLRRTVAHPDLVVETRAALRATGVPYVVENVPGAPLHNPIRLCGTSFWLPLRRHRLFESSVFMLGVSCAHSRFREPRYWTSWKSREGKKSTVVQVYGAARPGRTQDWAEAMGVDWMTGAELSQAIPPAYTEYLGRQLLQAVIEEATHATA